MRSPRVLVISPIPSHPADQGNSARIQALAAELMSRGLVLEFFYYGMEGLSEAQRTDMQAFWADFHFMASLPLPDPKFGHCWGIDDWCPAALCDAVRGLHETRHYDAVLVNYVWMSRVLVDLRDTFRIIDTHDIFGERNLVAVREGLEPRWFFTTIRQENDGFLRADLLIGIQDYEAQCIRERVAVETITIGHCLSPFFLSSFAGGRPLVSFGYIGSSNPWNVRCVLALDAAIGADGGIDWLLAGSLLRKQLRFVSAPHLLGFVAKLEDFYGVIDCVVNPMMGGTGLKIKTVEALAFGKPVIGTIDAFQGLPATHPAQQLRSAGECADAMRRYQADEAFRSELRLASRMLYFEYMMRVGGEITSLADRILQASRGKVREAVPQASVVKRSGAGARRKRDL
jgi:glycosyltransferase involved in cell wall biosynthesis